MWCVEFWDFGAWNEVANTRRQYKKQAITLCQRMNKAMPHAVRRDSFEGHRYRVRKSRN